MKASPVVQYRNPFWRNAVMRTRGIGEGWDRVVANLVPVEYLEAKLRVNRTKGALAKLRKEGYLPGYLTGGKGQFDVPIALRFNDARSMHDRGGFEQRCYKLILENRVTTVKCVFVHRDSVTRQPIHFVFRRQPLEEPPLLNEREKEMQAWTQEKFTTHVYHPDRVPTSFPKIWMKEEGGLQ